MKTIIGSIHIQKDGEWKKYSKWKFLWLVFTELDLKYVWKLIKKEPFETK